MNETVKETVKEVVSSIKDMSDLVTEPAKKRMAHPFIGSFAISWILLNWRPIIYFILTKSTVEDRISYIEENFYNPNYLFYFPIVAALFYTVGIKWLDRLSNWMTKNPEEYNNSYHANLKIDKIANDMLVDEKQKEFEIFRSENKPLKELNLKLDLATSNLITKEEELSNLQTEFLIQTNKILALEREKHDLMVKNEKHKLSNSDLIKKLRGITLSRSIRTDMLNTQQISALDRELKRLDPNISMEISVHTGEDNKIKHNLKIDHPSHISFDLIEKILAKYLIDAV
ncbi:hypothetical protein [Sphingobacterium kitahiroshimense]|uniref:hypothetical protein n=1 Tax=Sphingobacterium kitahiroshimense TaxID=470446 RepID=UPI00320B2A64